MSQYRRTPPPTRQEPGPLPRGRRLVAVGVGLVVLAAIVVAILVVGADDTEETGPPETTTSAAPPVTGGRAPDVVLAATLLPATLGEGWVEVSREDDPVAAEVDPDDPCAVAGQPIQRGLVVRAAFDHLGATAITEQASIVAGVIEEGVAVPRLDDPVVVDCLQQGLAPQLAEGSELVVVEQPTPAAADGAEVSGLRLEVRRDGGTAGHFDFVLARRDRAVSFLLIAVNEPEQATPLDDLLAALDGPLAAVEPRLN